jgi:hypothetical protein
MEQEIQVYGVTHLVDYTYKYNPQVGEDELTVHAVNGIPVESYFFLPDVERAVLKFEQEKAEDESLGL